MPAAGLPVRALKLLRYCQNALDLPDASSSPCGSTVNTFTADRPSRLPTLERQLLLINGRPGVRVTDTEFDEIGIASGRFRLVVHLKTWRIFTSFGIDNLGSSSVGP
jgi:hypothetical protein